MRARWDSPRNNSNDLLQQLAEEAALAWARQQTSRTLRTRNFNWRGAVPWNDPYPTVFKNAVKLDPDPDDPRRPRQAPPAFRDGVARPNQLRPGTPGAESQRTDWLGWLVLAGRGFGKTRTGAEAVRDIAEAGIASPIALAAPTAGDARDVLIEGESGLLECHPYATRPHYEPSKLKVTWDNGVEAHIYSADEPERFRGKQHAYVWADEIAAWRYLEEAWTQMLLGLRLGRHPQIIATTTPRPYKIIKELVLDPNWVVTRGTTYDNLGNLAPQFRKTILSKYEGTRMGRQELNAEILDDVEGALWQRQLIDQTRLMWRDMEAIHLNRVVTGVDPGGTQAQTGIVTVGKDSRRPFMWKSVKQNDDHCYTLDDATAPGASPNDWGMAAVNSYAKFHGDRIVGETNNGGPMVQSTIKTVDRRAAFKGVHASRGKQARAEPVAALMEQGRAHMVGSYPELEDELCQWVPGDPAMPSPNRLDAYVWAVTELMLMGSEPPKGWTPTVIEEQSKWR